MFYLNKCQKQTDYVNAEKKAERNRYQYIFYNIYFLVQHKCKRNI